MPNDDDPRLLLHSAPTQGHRPRRSRPPQDEDAVQATQLDPHSWPTGTQPADDPGPPEAGRRAAVWHGAAPAPPRRARRRRRPRGWLLPTAVLTAVLVYLGWSRLLPAHADVASVSIGALSPRVGCHTTVRVVGTVHTTGGGGTIGYRWRRSDGTASDVVRMAVAAGDRRTDVVMLWTLEGPGTLTARVTLEVLTPQQRSARASFRYVCG